MEMGDSENQDEILLLHIDDSVRKASDQASPRIFVEHLPRSRELPDLVYREEYLPEELRTRAGSFAVLVIDRVVKLGLCDVKESDIHLALYSARTSSAETVGAAPDL
jgi:hypothetical protein